MLGAPGAAGPGANRRAGTLDFQVFDAPDPTFQDGGPPGAVQNGLLPEGPLDGDGHV
jgi:hypothetical protein